MRNFIRETFSEDDGMASASRVLMFLHALAGLVWTSFVVWHAKALPDATSMVGLTGFVTAPYAINKMHAAVASFSEKDH